MEPQTMQEPVDNEQDFTTNELASALGFSTKISEDWLAAQVPQEEEPQEAPAEQQEPQGEEMPDETAEEAPEEKEEPKNEDKEEDRKKLIEEEVKKAVDEQLAPIKEALQKALEEEPD